CPNYTNQLNLIGDEGYKIPVIENLGATLDQFDAIDFSDNEIRKLDGFPLLRRLKTLLVNNNRICRIGEGLDQALPCLTELILTNNSLVELGDLDPLASLKSLTYLSILRNPVTNKKHYRLYVIYKVPQVRVLDFQKVKLKDTSWYSEPSSESIFLFEEKLPKSYYLT
uniref:Small nuclear ribonucleoprotein polypeptide A' n=1 Tax=Spermophilus dauricus TaxID=99837 RepID=A0A8C9Q424_SPEDA